MKITAAVLCAALLTGCATIAPVQPQPDPELAAAMEGSETGSAVGVLTTPAAVSVYKWIGQALLQILINTKIDVKVDATGETLKDKK